MLQMIFKFLLVCMLAAGCTQRSDRRVVTMWHFWSEPRQRAALDELIEDFEQAHPNVDVQTTVLNWADGKSKLQLAFNAGTQPDIIHLGLDWFSEFDVEGTFAGLPDSLVSDGRACRWVVNSRAFISNVPNDSALRVGGLCVSDPHNVVKRILPLLWQRGSRLFQRLPIWRDLDDTFSVALWNVVQSSKGAVRERSRQLDEMLLRGQIPSVITGSWIIDMARAQGRERLYVTPIPSILNADVLSVSARSTVQSDAHNLIGFLSRYDNARRFCISVSDAGYPADLDRALLDTVFVSDPLKRGFLETARMSRPIVHSSKTLSVEPVIEEMLERAYASKSQADVIAVMKAAQVRVAAIESR